MELKDRIKNVIDFYKISIPKFAKFVGFKTPQAVRELLKGNTKTLSDAAFYKITTACPELNPEWLLTGEGSMLRDGGAEETRNTAEQGAAIAIGGNATGHYSVTTSPMSDEERQELVKLRAENAGLRAQLEEKERTIQILLNARR